MADIIERFDKGDINTREAAVQWSADAYIEIKRLRAEVKHLQDTLRQLGYHVPEKKGPSA